MSFVSHSDPPSAPNPLAAQMRLEETIRLLLEGPDTKAAGKDTATPWVEGVRLTSSGRDWRKMKHPTDENLGTRPEKVRDLVWDVINHQLTDLAESHDT